MGEWFIKLGGNRHDLVQLYGMLRSSHAEVVDEDNVYYLRSTRFLGHNDPHEVHRVATELVNQLKGAARVVAKQTLVISVQGIERTHEGDPRTQFIMAETIGPTARVFAPGIVQEGGSAPSRRQETYLERIAADAEIDDAVAKVMRLVGGSELSWIDLSRIYEVIEHDVGSRKHITDREWLSRTEIDRFTHTADNPEASGDAARHGASKYSPPKNPMPLEEAQSLVLELACQWISSKNTRNRAF